MTDDCTALDDEQRIARIEAENEHAVLDPDAVEVIIGCKQDTEAELSDCHHYEGIRCIHTAECSYESKRNPCPFDDAEARTCPTCGGNGYVQMGGNDWRKTCPGCRGTGEKA